MIDALRRWVAVWRHNALVWCKSALTVLLGGFVEPVLYRFALRYGPGGICRAGRRIIIVSRLSERWNPFYQRNECLYIRGVLLAYTRMEVLCIWDGMLLAAPLSVEDVVIG